MLGCLFNFCTRRIMKETRTALSPLIKEFPISICLQTTSKDSSRASLFTKLSLPRHLRTLTNATFDKDLNTVFLGICLMEH